METEVAVERLRLRSAPMLAAALCFAAGDAAAQQWRATFFLAVSTLLLLALAAISLLGVRRVAWAPVLALWLVVGCWAAQVQRPILRQDALTAYADGLSRTVLGRVTGVRALRHEDNDAAPQQAQEPWRMEPGAWEVEPQAAAEQVDLAVEQVEDVTPDVSTMRPAQGGVRVTLLGPPPALNCGDVLQMPLRLRIPETYRDAGAWSHADALLADGIAAQASVKAEAVQRVGAGAASWMCRLAAAQNWAAARMEAYAASPQNQRLPAALRLSARDAAMLNAMLFGDRSGLTTSMRENFERTGTFHLFVISGLHIVLLAGGLFWLLRRLRVPEGLAVSATLLVASVYALLTGFGVPVQRALGMTAVYLLARWLGRDRSALNALGCAALAVLACDPRALFEASFQMTFLVIVAIAGIAAPLADRLLAGWRSAAHELWLVRLDAHLPPRVAQLRVRLRMFGDVLGTLLGRRWHKLPQWLLRPCIWSIDIILIALVAECCMVLPMALYFHRATLLALPLNVVAMPLVSLLLCTTVALFCLALVSAKAAAVPGALAALLVHVVHGLVTRLGGTAVADLRVPGPGFAAMVAACAAVVLACWALRTRAWWWVGVGAIAMVPLAVLWPAPPALHPGTLEVTALDVGQGDSLLVVSPQGRTLLVDAGGPVGRQGATDGWDVGEQVVAPYLWSRGIRRLDAVLLTHAHSDHMGGMPAVLRDFHPRELWLSVQPGHAPALLALRQQARALGIAIKWFRAGDDFAWGGLSANVLSPEVEYANGREAVNDDSLVMRLSFGKASALLEGDAETPSEESMLAHRRIAPATLLKVGHHGSNTSTTQAFLDALAPRDAVVSVGRHNTFGHPRFEVLGRLEAAHVITYRTDRAGAETFLLSSDGGIAALPAASN